MKQFDMFTRAESDAARNEALDRVAENSNQDGWWDEACTEVQKLRAWTGTGEDLRLLLSRMIGSPHDDHAWGALVANAKRNGWLIETGERRKMHTKKSHSRKTDVLRSKW